MTVMNNRDVKNGKLRSWIQYLWTFVLTSAFAESKSSLQWKTNRDFHCRNCKRLARQILPPRISQILIPFLKPNRIACGQSYMKANVLLSRLNINMKTDTLW